MGGNLVSLAFNGRSLPASALRVENERLLVVAELAFSRIIDLKHLSAGDSNPTVLQSGGVRMDPARVITTGGDFLDNSCFHMESEDRSRRSAIVRIPKVSDDVDPGSDQGRRVKVRWRENLARIAEDFDAAISVVNEDVVVDAEVRVVVVFVLASDLNEAPVRKTC